MDKLPDYVFVYSEDGKNDKFSYGVRRVGDVAYIKFKPLTDAEIEGLKKSALCLPAHKLEGYNKAIDDISKDYWLIKK